MLLWAELWLESRGRSVKRDVTFQAGTDPQGWFLQHIWVQGKGWQELVAFKREQILEHPTKSQIFRC